MNNNQRNNNRRRGRGGNRQQGGGQQLNRIDSRARGNAPQLLEKYRKLAHDAHLNGDRVQEEYYLQFADHYFRVLADQRQRQDEQREQRDPRPQRWQEGGEQSGWREEGDEGSEYGADSEYPAYDQQSTFQRAPRPSPVSGPQEDRIREDRPRDESFREDRPREQARDDAGEGVEEARSPFEPPENPFVREGRNTRGLRPRRDDRRPRQNRDERDFDDRGEAQSLGLDPASLPPPISAAREEAPVEVASDDGIDGEAKPRRRTRKPRPPADDAGEKLETVT